MLVFIEARKLSYAYETESPFSRFGDRQVPEGRTDPGGDIMIHGSRVSIGCLAMGDPTAEDLFILAAQTGIENISVILSPVDFRIVDIDADLSELPDWAPQLYMQIKTELDPYRK